MFLLTEIKYLLTRSPGRSAILMLVALMLVCSMGAYKGNAHASQGALDNLAESIPVTARVVSRDGSKNSGLSITSEHYDALVSANVRNVLSTAEAAAALHAPLDTSYGGDVTVMGVSRPDAFAAVSKEEMRFLEGFDETSFSGTEPLCAVEGGFAKANGLELGDELELPFCLGVCSAYGQKYSDIGKLRVKVIAHYPYTEVNGERSPNMLVPVEWLKEAVEQADEEFYYSSLSVELQDPMDLNAFKEALPSMGFYPVDSMGADVFWSCDGVSMEDELFIKAAEELQENLRIYNRFQPLFYILVTLMVVLAVFLTLRGSRRDMAIASSLGESRRRIGGVHLVGILATQLAGGAAAQVVLVSQFSLTPWDSLQILAAYLICAGIGTILALVQLFRFDTLTLLTKSGELGA